MKIITTLLFLVLLSVTVFSQTNFALYSLENTYPICLSNDNNEFFGLSWSENTAQVKSYNLATGKVIREFETILPANPVKLMISHPKKKLIYLITAKKIDDTENRYIDAIYSLNTKNGKLKQLREVYYKYKVPNKLGIVGNDIVLTTLGDPTWLFNLKTNDFRLLNPNIDYQLLSIAPKQKGYLMLYIRETYGGKVPVFFMDEEGKFSDTIGYISPELKIRSEEKNVQLPTITFVDSSFNWVIEAIRFNSFPIYKFQIAMRPYWLKQTYKLDKVFMLSGIIAANETYIIARSSSSILVYNYAEPYNSAPATFSESDVADLEAYLKDRPLYNRVLINSDPLKKVFNALFYEVYSKNRLIYIAVQQNGNYYELKEYDKLLPLLNPDFKVTDRAQANLFQEALDVLYPVDDFEKENIQNYSSDSSWIFVRGVAFENKYGVIVNLNDSLNITGIEYKSKL